jgi:hypothetical protein
MSGSGKCLHKHISDTFRWLCGVPNWLAELFLFSICWVDASAMLNKNFRGFLHSLQVKVRIKLKISYLLNCQLFSELVSLVTTSFRVCSWYLLQRSTFYCHWSQTFITATMKMFIKIVLTQSNSVHRVTHFSTTHFWVTLERTLFIHTASKIFFLK